jgi:RHS repeat-associated protein
VLSTISDKKVGVSAGGVTVDYYNAEVLSQNDYYAFGMMMPGRKYSVANTNYRYGFNGKEKLDEIKGEGNSLDYGARIQDPRLGRWLSVDPLQKKYPGESPYFFTGGNPIYFTDPDGKDRIEYMRTIGKDGTVLLKIQTTKGLYRSVWNNTYSGVGYATKNDYAVYTTHDYRSGKEVVTKSTETLYGSGHSTEVGFGTYLKIKATGSDGPILPKLPQLIVYGSNSEDPGFGSKADPNRPITVINFAEFEAIMGLVMVGMKVPDLKGADPKKIPEIIDKFRKKDISDSKASEERASEEINNPTNPKVYSGYKKGTILYTGENSFGNVKVDSDSTATCCQADKKATDTLPSAKQKKE